MGNLTIKEIQALLQNAKDESDPTLTTIKIDPRKGVQQLYKKWEKEKLRAEELHTQFENMLAYEKELRRNGIKYIAGIDEVGRGPLAGPVVAAAVILKEDFYLPGLTDSKKLSPAKRETFYEYIIDNALAYGIGVVPAKEIDTVNIYEATKIAMIKAIKELPIEPEHLLIDAMKLPIGISQTSIIKGDATSISIAASSVLAKETRDRYMKNLGETHPSYGFENHMGYGTKEHLEAIETHGIISEHRKSFAPIKSYVS
ncbi:MULTISPECIES: ribonuclease HII [Bacillus]|uniref:ribonuclease HII n=1 Tax=Bacillus TaxID=1386 RepID=UPI000BB7AF4F|nr:MULTISPECIES: ribonuclease HII [Bacillus]